MVFNDKGGSTSFAALLSSVTGGSSRPEPSNHSSVLPPSLSGKNGAPPPRPKPTTSSAGNAKPGPVLNKPTSSSRPVLNSRPSSGSTSAKPSSSTSTLGVKRTDSGTVKPRPKPASLQTGQNGRPAMKPSTSASASSNGPSSATEPKKGSWKEIMARAEAAKAMGAPVAGTIVHKPKPKAETQKKEWQKKLAEQRAAKDGKTPTTSTVPAKPAGKADLAVGKGKTAAPSKPAKEVLPPYKSTIAKSSRNSEPPAKRKFSERPPSPKRAKKGSYSSKYVYAEDYSDYSDESDMEATGFDLLAEEERSTRLAIKEDLEQERLEARLAAQKAAMKKTPAKR